MKILICGSRGWRDPAPIRSVILESQAVARDRGEKLTVIHGDAPKGADRVADREARRAGVAVIREPADWNRYGKAAGPIRNQKMIDIHQPDFVFAFRAHGKSNGTDDMVARAKKANIPTTVTHETRHAESA